jgi:hypothetical protein
MISNFPLRAVEFHGSRMIRQGKTAPNAEIPGKLS